MTTTVCIRIKRINDSSVEWVCCVNVENINIEKKNFCEALKFTKEKTRKMWGVVEMYFMTKRNK